MATTLGLVMIAPLVDAKQFKLPVQVILPYSVENSILFWATFLQECICGFAVSVTHLSVDNTFFGLLLIIKRHQEVLKHRIQNLVSFSMSCESKSGQQKVNVEHELKKIIKDHQHIYRYSILFIYLFYCDTQ